MLEWLVCFFGLGFENDMTLIFCAGFKFDNTYAWCMRFDESGQVVEVRAYLDSQMVKQAIEENESDEAERKGSPVLAS